MKKYRTPLWEIRLPDDWQVEEDGDSPVFLHSEGVGELQISTLEQARPVSGEDLLAFAGEHVDAGAEVEEVTLGEFDGIVLDYESGGEYACEWYLACGRIFLFATYVCDAGAQEQEYDIIELMLESLRLAA